MKKKLVPLILCLQIGPLYAVTESQFLTDLKAAGNLEAVKGLYNEFKERRKATPAAPKAYVDKLVSFKMPRSEAENFIKTGVAKPTTPPKEVPNVTTTNDYKALMGQNITDKMSAQNWLNKYDNLQNQINAGKYSGDLSGLAGQLNEANKLAKVGPTPPPSGVTKQQIMDQAHEASKAFTDVLTALQQVKDMDNQEKVNLVNVIIQPAQDLSGFKILPPARL